MKGRAPRLGRQAIDVVRMILPARAVTGRAGWP